MARGEVHMGEASVYQAQLGAQPNATKLAEWLAACGASTVPAKHYLSRPHALKQEVGGHLSQLNLFVRRDLVALLPRDGTLPISDRSAS